MGSRTLEVQVLMQRISLVVVHDNFLIRTGLTNAFAGCEDFAVRAPGPGDAPLLDHDVVVADLDSGMRALDLASTLPAGVRRPRVVIVTDSDREWQIRNALAQGVAAYLLLGMTGEELVSAVRRVSQGGCHLSPSVSARLAESLTAEPLTARQEDVLALLADGLCNKHIAARLGIALGTVKTHLRTAFEKLQVSNRSEAIAAAGRRGLLRDVQVEAKVRSAPLAADRRAGVANAARPRHDGLARESLRMPTAAQASLLAVPAQPVVAAS
jgi:two-component system NarL family response regulator